MSKQVFYVEEWTNQYKIYKVKAKSQAEAMEDAKRGGSKSQTLSAHNQPPLPPQFRKKAK